jgi:hypothetical protein
MMKQKSFKLFIRLNERKLFDTRISVRGKLYGYMTQDIDEWAADGVTCDFPTCVYDTRRML